jgi:hypothetical protein
MIAGLPGTGLGGIFYIASAVFMPVHRLLRGHGHDGRNWQRILAQGGIALGILVMLFLTGWLIGLLVMPDLQAATGATGGRRVLAGATIGMARWVAIIGTAGILTLLLVSVEIAGFIAVHGRRARLRAHAAELLHVGIESAAPEAEAA